MLVRFNDALPELVSVTVWAALAEPTDWFPKTRLEVERLATGAVPLPETATVCGLPVASSATAMDALRVPADVGVNVTLIVQLDPAARVDPQPLVWVKSVAFVPVTIMLETFIVAVPVFLSVTVLAELLLPTE
jgi:hypothetical protein